MDWRKIGYLVMFAAFEIILYMYMPVIGRGLLNSRNIMLGLFTLTAIFIYFRSPRKEIHLLFALVMFILLTPPLVQSYAISMSSGTVLTDNWWHALNWMRENTTNCSVIATYWDPGHFITGIAQRPVVFDGATQNAMLVKDVNGTRIVRSRIQDIATVLYTSNESEAIDILKNYRIDDCDMYFIASRDLVFKAQWWTYFSTWRPGVKGKMQVYYVGTMSDRKKSLDGKTDEIDYRVGGGTIRLLIINGTDVRAYFQTPEGAVAGIPRIIMVGADGKVYEIKGEKGLDATLLVYMNSPSAVLIPKSLENSLFTRMFFFNGAGLKHFKFVNDWGGEVKLFRVEFGKK